MGVVSTRAKVYTCPSCGLVCKDETTLALRTLIPGGAYFYAGLTGPGVLAALIEVLFWFALLSFVISPKSDRAAEGATVGFVVGYYLFLIAFEKLINYLHARRFVRQFEPVNVSDTSLPASMAAVAH